jgi:hypothetical protein
LNYSRKRALQQECCIFRKSKHDERVAKAISDGVSCKSVCLNLSHIHNLLLCGTLGERPRNSDILAEQFAAVECVQSG